MLYTALTLIGTTLLLTFAASYMILRAAIPEKLLRRMMLFFVIFTPFAAVVALVKALLFTPRPVRYNAELGKIEDEIEQERASLFGENVMHPSFSERWKVSYLYTVEKSAAAAIKLDPTLDHSLCGISSLR
jgi:Na+/H+-dicarboxylate symporter